MRAFSKLYLNSSNPGLRHHESPGVYALQNIHSYAHSTRKQELQYELLLQNVKE